MCPFEELLSYGERKFAGRSQAVQCAARAIAVDEGSSSGLQGYGLVSCAKSAAVGGRESRVCTGRPASESDSTLRTTTESDRVGL